MKTFFSTFLFCFLHTTTTQVQAFWTGAKVSYQPYRAASTAMFTLIKTTASKYSTVPVHFERSSIDEGFLIFEFENVKKLRGSGEYDDDEEDDEEENEDEEEDESLPPTELDEDDRMIECQKVVRRDFYKFYYSLACISQLNYYSYR